MGGCPFCHQPGCLFSNTNRFEWDPDTEGNRGKFDGGSLLTRIYTLMNQKGGVGKTTTTINIGAYLARFGQRVLVVDLDPQANATSCLGVDKDTVQGGTYEAL